MFEKLKASMAAQGWAGIDAVEEVWESDLASRPIVSGFLKDKEIGAKRLASMPDRVTNTINTVGGGQARTTHYVYVRLLTVAVRCTAPR